MDTSSAAAVVVGATAAVLVPLSLGRGCCCSGGVATVDGGERGQDGDGLVMFASRMGCGGDNAVISGAKVLTKSGGEHG